MPDPKSMRTDYTITYTSVTAKTPSYPSIVPKTWRKRTVMETEFLIWL